MNKYALVGRSLGHSFSRNYFSEKFEKEDVKGVYINKEFSQINDVKDLRSDKELCGFNVTIPFKEQIIPLLDDVGPIAMEIGAVNTVKIKDGQWIGHNTDVFGFKQMIKPFFKSHHERAIIFGTGGASKAVAYVLEEIGATVLFISRDPKGENQFGYQDLNENMLDACKILVNTTPVGTFPNIDETLDIPFELLTPKHLVIDLIYNPEKTKFLQNAEEQGAWILNGRTMLEQQAEESWRIWNS